ncbi:MAG: hypothetical protein ACTHN5_16555 [Phycisphaerae bacterium]
MDLEKLSTRARLTLLLISFVGVLVTAAGAVLLAAIISRTMVQPNAIAADWLDGVMRAQGPLAIIGAGLMIALLPWAIWPLVSVALRRATDARFRNEQLLGTLEAQRQMLESIRETSSLSDAAKQVAYRAKDLEALRQAIREDMERQDFEAATILANEMERRFGYGKEADKWRAEINRTSAEAIEARIQETSDHVESLIKQGQWIGAIRETDRLKRQFPDRVEPYTLRDRIDTARDDHKRELLKQWKDAIAKDDVDSSLALLRKLDQYLTPSEADAYKESARDVFRKRLQQLQAQFAIHVHDKNWAEALRIGKQITDEFPNTRMAAEVREKLPVLQERAAQPVAV